jgi:hypothetical protein
MQQPAGLPTPSSLRSAPGTPDGCPVSPATGDGPNAFVVRARGLASARECGRRLNGDSSARLRRVCRPRSPIHQNVAGGRRRLAPPLASAGCQPAEIHPQANEARRGHTRRRGCGTRVASCCADQLHPKSDGASDACFDVSRRRLARCWRSVGVSDPHHRWGVWPGVVRSLRPGGSVAAIPIRKVDRGNTTAPRRRSSPSGLIELR